jgi:hypothetical protein
MFLIYLQGYESQQYKHKVCSENFKAKTQHLRINLKNEVLMKQ